MAKSYGAFKSILREIVESKYVKYNKKILILGYGSVGQCILPLIIKHIADSPKQITVLERGENQAKFKERNEGNGVKYVKKAIVKDNLEETLSKYTEEGGFVVDVSLNIDALSIIEWCLKNGRLYTNTSLERWETQPDETIPKLSERTLYHTHKVVREMAAAYIDGPTAVVTNGANPGLVTQLTKRALLKLADEFGDGYEAPEDKNGWAELMRELGVKVVHIAEKDSQILDEPKRVGEFVNTWSCEGFWAEGRAPSEMGWGTHENLNPDGGVCQGTAAYLESPGVSVLIKSWVPIGGSYNGYCIQHSEAVTISQYFETDTGDFRPSVYYVYQPCDSAIASVHELRGRELDMQAKHRIAKDEIVSGIDELGVLLIGDDFAVWHGSQLDIDTARKLVAGESATSVQVSSALLAGMVWAIENPNEGYTEPEDLPYDYILSIADPYLGKIAFEKTDWRPEEDKNSLFYREIDADNPCSFENFRVWT
jgi:homospermidine synthase